MCGIAGFLGTPAGARAFEPTLDGLEPGLARMTRALAHRGPDGHGSWSDAPAGIALGHRRLAILDPSPAGAQPMVSAGGRFVLVFNGEIYNFRELRRELEQTGARFSGGSDTEVMLAAFERWGVEESLPRFTGMFAFGVWDRDARSLVLARDRLGEKPLYYGKAGGLFLFASELKALRAHPLWEGGLDRDALAAYLRLGYVPGPFSIHANVRKLPPGTWLRVDANATDERDATGMNVVEFPAPKTYWSVRGAMAAGAARPFRGDARAAEEHFARLLGDAVEAQRVSDVPLGIFLSGGMDSAAIAALMRGRGRGSAGDAPHALTLGFEDPRYDESDFAADTAARLGLRHSIFRMSAADAARIVPDLPEIYDEPFADPSQLPTVLLARLARDHGKVYLTGDGGDELLGGYTRYRKAEALQRRRLAFPAFLRAPLAASMQGLLAPMRAADAWLPSSARRRNVPAKLERLAELLARDSDEAAYLRLVSRWTDPERLVPGAREARSLLLDVDRWPRAGDLTSRLMALDLETYLPDGILVKTDRAAMSAGVETRAPLLDPRVVEFAWSLPPDFKWNASRSKLPLAAILRRSLPDVAARPKRGFGIPLDAWLRGPLRPWAEELLDEEALRREGILDATSVTRHWKEHLAGARDHGWKLWTVLMFQAWARRWN